MTGATKADVHPVDEVLAPPKLFVLGLQHVLVMYAGAIAVPLILGRALKLPPETVALLINADLLACGIVTIIQSLGIGPIGIRLPVMMGVTFAAVGPMLAIAGDATIVATLPAGAAQAAIDAANGMERLLTIFGAAIAAGIFAILIAPVLSYLMPLFPPLPEKRRDGSLIVVVGTEQGSAFPFAKWACHDSGVGQGSEHYGIRNVRDVRYRSILNLAPEVTFKNRATAQP